MDCHDNAGSGRCRRERIVSKRTSSGQTIKTIDSDSKRSAPCSGGVSKVSKVVEARNNWSNAKFRPFRRSKMEIGQPLRRNDGTGRNGRAAAPHFQDVSTSNPIADRKKSE